MGGGDRAHRVPQAARRAREAKGLGPEPRQGQTDSAEDRDGHCACGGESAARRCAREGQPMSLLLNGLIVVASMRWLAPWSGVWSAELELEGDVVPTGPVTITSTEGLALVGTVDGDHSGTFGEKRHVRV